MNQGVGTQVVAICRSGSRCAILAVTEDGRYQGCRLHGYHRAGTPPLLCDSLAIQDKAEYVGVQATLGFSLVTHDDRVRIPDDRVAGEIGNGSLRFRATREISTTGGAGDVQSGQKYFMIKSPQKYLTGDVVDGGHRRRYSV